MERIGDIISKIIPSLNQGKPLVPNGQDFYKNRVVGDIEGLWCRVVDEDLRAHSYVEFVRNNTLFVKVDSSCYLSILKMKSRDILTRLQDAGTNIKNIKFRI